MSICLDLCPSGADHQSQETACSLPSEFDHQNNRKKEQTFSVLIQWEFRQQVVVVQNVIYISRKMSNVIDELLYPCKTSY